MNRRLFPYAVLWLAAAGFIEMVNAGQIPTPDAAAMTKPSDRRKDGGDTAVPAIHRRFTGKRGTLAAFGDSITVTMAFLAPIRHSRRNASPALEKASRRVEAELPHECWSDWKGPGFGSEGTRTVRWVEENVDAWLKRLNPEVVVILFGTNDVRDTKVDEYRTRLTTVVRKCEGNGSVPILTTPPPRHGYEREAARFADAVRGIAKSRRLPLVDYHREILRRRPADWDGALDRFGAYEGYEVPTLISRDGIHPSFPKEYQDDYSERGLRTSGYTLRNALTIMAIARVFDIIRKR